jgi:hypothetical protein
MTDDRWFEALARQTDVEDAAPAPASARLKSRIYSAMTDQMAAGGRLLSLTATRAGGRQLCVFEHAVALLPLGEDLKSRNPCRVCHARALGNRLEHAPIFWPGCPYSEFHNG